jgi:anti-anti-sigma factor
MAQTPSSGEPPPPVGTAELRADALHLSGEFDCANVQLLRDAVEQLAERLPGRFLIDLTEVTYLDSSGVSVLVQFAERRPRLLVRAGSLVERVLIITGLAELGLVETREPGQS